MPFIGNQPALSYTSFAKQDFSTSATTSYTLDNPVANANELALFINFVRQEPTTAYSASGTTLTLTSATASSDDMYCVYLGKAVQTVNPPNASVGTSQLADNAVTTAKITDANITSAKLASGVLPTNTPAWSAYLSSDQTVSNATVTKILFNTELIDTDNAYDNSTNYRFTVPSGKGGNYYVHASVRNGTSTDFDSFYLYIKKNGSDFLFASMVSYFRETRELNNVVPLVAGDYLEAFVFHSAGNSINMTGSSTTPFATHFSGFKLT